MRRVFGTNGSVAPTYRPDRLVVDAHIAAATDLAQTATRAGVPFLVDLPTHYLQDVQHAGHVWAQLPYATSVALSPADLMKAAHRKQLVTEVADVAA